MIIVDLSQTMISNLMVTLGKYADSTEIEIGLLRHFVLNSIRSYNSKFRDKYGEMIIAADGPYNWRKEVFPYYKANRAKNRKESKLDWNMIFQCLNQITEEIKEFLPYRVIKVDKAEADDVIATLCHEFGNTNEKILILSGDKDFKQLQTYINVEQYDPTRNRWIKENQPERFLKEHIIRGDNGDGVPNFLSDDDTLITDKRQKPISQKKLDVWLDQDLTEFCDEKMLRGFKRNEQVIDLSKIPENISKNIIDTFNNYPKTGRDKIFNYFIQNKLKNLMEAINDF